MNVEIWTAEDNFEDCGEVGATAVVTFEDDSLREAARKRIPELERYARQRIRLTGGDHFEAERDGDILRLHITPFDDLDDPDEWETADKATESLNRVVRYFAADKKLSLSIENA